MNLHPLRKHTWYVLSMVFITLGFSLIRSSKLPETDVLWSARNGQDIINGGSITEPIDTWNFQTLGETWSPNSWLWNVILGGITSLLGTFGFWLIVFSTTIAIFGLLWKIFHTTKIPETWQPILLLISGITLVQFLTGRSNTADVIILLLYTLVLLHARKYPVRIASGAILTLPLLMSALWVNLHFTGVLSVLLFPLATWVILLQNKPFLTKISYSALIASGALVGTLLTPFGKNIYDKLFIVQDESTQLITEWGPVIQPTEILWLHILTIIIALLFVGYFIKTRQHYVLVLALLVLSVQTSLVARYGMYLAVLLVLASIITKWKHLKTGNLKNYVHLGNTMVATTIMLVGGFLTVNLLMNPQNFYPVSIEDATQAPSDSRVLTDQQTGGVLIYYNHYVTVSLDGRNDLIGKEKMIAGYSALQGLNPAETTQWLDTNKVNAVMVSYTRYAEAASLIELLEQNSSIWDKQVLQTSILYTKK